MKTIFIMMIVSLGMYFTFAGDDNNNVEIKGAFGYFLGEDATHVRRVKSKILDIDVPAKIPFRNFTRCSLSLTDDNKIYYIVGEVVYDSPDETNSEFKIILDLLEKKYKTKFADTTKSYNPENNPDKLSFSLDRNQKHLMLLKLDKNTLRLLYCDTQVNVKENKKRLREYEKQNNNNPDAL